MSNVAPRALNAAAAGKHSSDAVVTAAAGTTGGVVKATSSAAARRMAEELSAIGLAGVPMPASLLKTKKAKEEERRLAKKARDGRVRDAIASLASHQEVLQRHREFVKQEAATAAREKKIAKVLRATEHRNARSERDARNTQDEVKLLEVQARMNAAAVVRQKEQAEAARQVQRVIQEDVARRAALAPGAVHVPINRTPEMLESRLGLPVLREEQAIMEAVLEGSQGTAVLICGETGSGKTTQVPQFLWEAGFGQPEGVAAHRGGLIAVTEPRRVAATAMAKRVAAELNEPFGGTVCYQVRYDNNLSPRCRLKFMTEGILLKEAQSDFLLSRYSAIVIDEAHERSVSCDLLIGLLSRVVPLRQSLYEEDRLALDAWHDEQQRHRALGGDGLPLPTRLPPPAIRCTPLRLVIMSATMRIADFRDNAVLFRSPPPVINVEARRFEVTPHFARTTERDNYVKAAISKVRQIHKKLPAGGILVFLATQRDIEQMCEALARHYARVRIRYDDSKQTAATAPQKRLNLHEDEEEAEAAAAAAGVTATTRQQQPPPPMTSPVRRMLGKDAPPRLAKRVAVPPVERGTHDEKGGDEDEERFVLPGDEDDAAAADGREDDLFLDDAVPAFKVSVGPPPPSDDVASKKRKGRKQHRLTSRGAHQSAPRSDSSDSSEGSVPEEEEEPVEVDDSDGAGVSRGGDAQNTFAVTNDWGDGGTTTPAQAPPSAAERRTTKPPGRPHAPQREEKVPSTQSKASGKGRPRRGSDAQHDDDDVDTTQPRLLEEAPKADDDPIARLLDASKRDLFLSADAQQDQDGDGDGDDDPEDDEEFGALDTLHILPLYSLLAPELQRLVFEPPPAGKRLCVVATNIAETSITIPNIRYVVDSGRAKQKRLDPVTQATSFSVSFISQAAAEQRCGRAGRVGPGHCYRLYSTAAFTNAMVKHSPPEIEDTPLDSVVLLMKSMRIGHVANFPFPSPPPKASLSKSLQHLQHIGALDAKFAITEMGHYLVHLPVSPRLAKMIWSARKDVVAGRCGLALWDAMLAAVAVCNSTIDVFRDGIAVDVAIRRRVMHGGSDVVANWRTLMLCCQCGLLPFRGRRGNPIPTASAAWALREQLRAVLNVKNLGEALMLWHQLREVVEGADRSTTLFKERRDSDDDRRHHGPSRRAHLPGSDLPEVKGIYYAEDYDGVETAGAEAAGIDAAKHRAAHTAGFSNSLPAMDLSVGVVMPPAEETAVRRWVVSGLIDQVARRASPLECRAHGVEFTDGRRTTKTPYYDAQRRMILYIHPKSSVSRVVPPPEWVVYTAVQVSQFGADGSDAAGGGAKRKAACMRGVTVALRQWLDEAGYRDPTDEDLQGDRSVDDNDGGPS